MFQNTMIFIESVTQIVWPDTVSGRFLFKTLGLVGNLKEIHHSEYLSTDIMILK